MTARTLGVLCGSLRQIGGATGNGILLSHEDVSGHEGCRDSDLDLIPGLVLGPMPACVWQVFLAHLWQLTLAHLWHFASSVGWRCAVLRAEA